MANKKYKLTDGNMWATDGIHDFGQNKTQREINAALVQADSDLSGAITNGTLLDGAPSRVIPEYSDLNNYTTPGTYYIMSDADAVTIAHAPRSASGTLYVIARASGTGSTYKTQIYLPTTSRPVLCIRTGGGSTIVWEQWQDIWLTDSFISGQPQWIIGSNSDLNDITDPGSYYISSDAAATTIANMPRSASGSLHVISRGDSNYYAVQIYIPTTSYPITYYRLKSGTSWTSWSVLGEIIVDTGTVTTSSNGTASLGQTYNCDQYMCLSVVCPDAVSGYILIPYKYGDAANGRWGFKAVTSSSLSAIASTQMSYIAILYRYK